MKYQVSGRVTSLAYATVVLATGLSACGGSNDEDKSAVAPTQAIAEGSSSSASAPAKPATAKATTTPAAPAEAGSNAQSASGSISASSLPAGSKTIGSTSTQTSESAAPTTKAPAATSSCKVNQIKSFGTYCAAPAVAVMTHGTTKSFENSAAGYKGSVVANCSAGFLTWSAGTCSSATVASIVAMTAPAPIVTPSAAAEPTVKAAAVDSAKTTIDSSTQLKLAGAGISSVYATGCTPALNNDFIDNGSWSVRRLEPRDCSVVQTATPVFSWLQPSDRNISIPWTLTLRKASGEVLLTKTSGTPRLLLSDTTLAAGGYSWTVSYTDTKKQVRSSESRRFSVSDAGAKISLPSGIALANAASAKTHPRLLPAGVSAAQIATTLRASELASSFSNFLARGDTALSTPLAAAPAAPTALTASVTTSVSLAVVRGQAEAERSAIEALGYSFLFTGNAKYQQAGITRLVALAAWPTDGATSEAIQDQANREIYLALAQGLDFFGSALKADQTAQIVAALKERIRQARADIASLDGNPYNSHVLTATQYVTEALMYAVGTTGFTEAKSWLAESWEVWITGTIGIWGGSDGAYGNGEAYGWYTMASFPRTVAAVRLIANIDLAKWAAVGNFGDNQLAFTAPAVSKRNSFGDDVETATLFSNTAYDSYRLLASLTRNPSYEWYWRQSAAAVSYKGILSPANYLIYGLYPARPAAVAPTKNSWLFEDAGLVAIHSKISDPNRSSVYFRSSRLGSFSHSHADNNAFTFSSKGKDILISGGYYPYYNSPHHLAVARATRFKNALTFDGGLGQAEPVAAPTAPGKPVFTMNARGKIVNFADTGPWAATTGDATLAYQGFKENTQTWVPMLTNAIRSVAYQRDEKVLVVYDWATSATARKWELNFQTLAAPTMDKSTVVITNGGVSACLDVYGPSGSTSISSGFPVAPENGAPTQYRAIFKNTAAATQLVSVTVIREDCRQVPVSVDINGTKALVTVNNGAPITFDQKALALDAK